MSNFYKQSEAGNIFWIPLFVLFVSTFFADTKGSSFFISNVSAAEYGGASLQIVAKNDMKHPEKKKDKAHSGKMKHGDMKDHKDMDHSGMKHEGMKMDHSAMDSKHSKKKKGNARSDKMKHDGAHGDMKDHKRMNKDMADMEHP